MMHAIEKSVEQCSVGFVGTLGESFYPQVTLNNYSMLLLVAAGVVLTIQSEACV
jgi:hypothetical protein